MSTKKTQRKEPNKTKTGKPNLKVMNVNQLEEMRSTARPKMIPVINNRINNVMRKAGRGR
jgi:hypothetical protein